MIRQTNFVFTEGRLAGTTDLSNCMGVVIHSPAKSRGCLAHIEAETSINRYLDVFADYIHQMIHD
jgi:hypothetical protein